MYKYSIQKVSGNWGLINRETGKPETIVPTLKQAKAVRAELETKELVHVESVPVEAGEKIAKVTHANYAANMARAHALREKMKDHVQATGGFPSHRTVQAVWGYDISLKALCRHKKVLAKELHLRKPKTTLKLQRTKV